MATQRLITGRVTAKTGQVAANGRLRFILTYLGALSGQVMSAGAVDAPIDANGDVNVILWASDPSEEVLTYSVELSYTDSRTRRRQTDYFGPVTVPAGTGPVAWATLMTEPAPTLSIPDELAPANWPAVLAQAAAAATVPQPATLADLAAMTRPTGVAVVFVMGNAQPFDGGGGAFGHRTGDATSAHNPPNLVVGADGSRWQRITTAIFNDPAALPGLLTADAALDARLDALEPQVASQGARVAAIEAAAGNLALTSSRLNGLDGAVASLDSRLDVVEAAGGAGADPATAARLTTVEGAAVSLDARLDVVEPQVSAVQARVGAIEQVQAATRLTSLESSRTAHGTRLDALEASGGGGGGDASLGGRVTTLEGTATSLGNRLGAVEASTASFDSRLDVLEAGGGAGADTSPAVLARLSSIETQNTTDDARLDAIEAARTTEAAATRLAALESAASVDNARIAALQGADTALDARLDALEGGAVAFPLLRVGPNRLMWGAAPPTTGAALRGDIVFNTAGALGGNAGWYCHTAGTPGQWAPFGIIGGAGPVTPAAALQWIDNAMSAGDGDFPYTLWGKQWKRNVAGTAYDIMSLADNDQIVKFQVNRGDARPDDRPLYWRNELSGSPYPRSAADGDFWVSWTEIHLQMPDVWWVCPFQFFDLLYNSPSFKMELIGTSDANGVRNNLSFNVAGGPAGQTRLQRELWRGPKPTLLRTHNYVMRVRQHPENGEADVWIQGNAIIAGRGLPIGCGSIPSAYEKKGLYCYDKLDAMTPAESIVCNYESGMGADLLRARINAPLPVPQALLALYPMGVYTGAGGVRLLADGAGSTGTGGTGGGGTGGTITGENLIDGLAPSVLDFDTSAGANTAAAVRSWDADSNTLALRGTGTSYGARARWAIPVTPGRTYRLLGNMSGASMNMTVGTGINGAAMTDILGATPATIGVGNPVGRDFTVPAGVTTVHLRLNRQSATTIATYAGLDLRELVTGA